MQLSTLNAIFARAMRPRRRPVLRAASARATFVSADTVARCEAKRRRRQARPQGSGMLSADPTDPRTGLSLPGPGEARRYGIEPATVAT